MSYRDKFRPASRGGFLNDRDGQIVGTAFKAGRLDGAPPSPGESVPLWAVFYIQEDGREELTTQHFKVCGQGGNTDWHIAKDGKTAKAMNDNAKIWRTDDGLSELLSSMVDTAGMDESQFPDPSVASDLNFEWLEGERFHWVQVERTDAYAKAHPRKDKNNPERTYPLTYTAVSAHLGNPDKQPTNGNGKTPDQTIVLKAQKAVTAALKKATNKKLALKDLKTQLNIQLLGDPDRNAVTEYALDSSNLQSMGFVHEGNMVRSEVPF